MTSPTNHRQPVVDPGSGYSDSEAHPSGPASPGFLSQFLTLQKKNFNQKKRAACSTCLELLLPVLFILGLVALWAASDVSEKPAEHYVSPFNDVAQVGTTVRSMLCTNGSTSIPGIRPCNTSLSIYCPPSGVLPVDGTCTDALAQVDLYIPHLIFQYPKARTIPTLDDMIAARWLARLLIGDYDNMAPSDYQQPDQAMAFGTDLYLVGNPSVTNSIAAYWNRTHPLFRYVYAGAFETFADVEPHIMPRPVSGKVWTVIDVQSISPTSFDVEIRMNRTAIPWAFDDGLPQRDYFESGLGSQLHRFYWANGFMSLQIALQDYYVTVYKNSSNTVTTPNFAVMPVAAHKNLVFLTVAGALAPLVLTLAYLYSVSQLTKRIVEEKEKRLREGMMIMGLNKAGFYFSWLATYMLQMLVSSSIITVVLKLTILQESDGSITFLLFLLFSLSTVTFASFMSSLFSKSRTAAVIAPLLYFATSIPTFAVEPGSQTRAFLMGLSWMPSNAFGVGSLLMFRYEGVRGIGWQDAWSPSDRMTIAEALIWLAADTILYFIVGVYLDAVLPSEWGTRRHPLFCLMFWKKDQPSEEIDVELKTPKLAHAEYREQTKFGHSHPSVRIRNLLKEFSADGTKKAAVDHVSMDIYEGDVTVLLGHNGAGKTTTINMLTGMLPVDGGDCEVYGKSVVRQMPEIRNNIGFCPQHNILWDDLTVREHLEFYAGIKGRSSAERSALAQQMIDECDLKDFADTLAGSLSGGNKRKLSIGNAFVGGSRLIFLDEPTAGMDVRARRQTWALIRRMTAGRTIVLTTHFMDEADLLGHHIAIMNHGQIYCSGSPMFLKSKLGVGYTLNIALDSAANSEQLFNTVSSFVNTAEILSAKGGELSVRLPMGSVNEFPALLEALETKGESLGARSFGISITTLEEVFLKISDQGQADYSQRKALPTPDSPPPAVVNVSQSDKLWPDDCVAERSVTFGQQLAALFGKRFHNSKRDRRTQCFQIFTPLATILLAMILGRWGPSPTTSLLLDPGYFLEDHLNLDTYNCGPMQPLHQKYIHTAVESVGAFPTIYNFSQYLLDTHDSHPFIRDTAIHCNGPQGDTIFTNTSSWHGAGLSVATYLQAKTNQALNVSNVWLNFRQNVLPFTATEEEFIDSFIAVIVGFFLLIPFTFIPSTFVSFVVKERENKAKHLQMVSGANYIAFWVANFLFDIVSFLLTELIMLLLLLIFNREEYVGSGEAVGAVLLLFFFYGLAGVSGSYLSSFLFETHGTAQNIVMLANFISGFLLVMLVYIMSILDSTKDAAKVIRYFTRIVPSYCLGEGIINLATLPIANLSGESLSPFDMDVVGWPILYLALEFPLFLILTMLIDHPSRELRRQQMFHDASTVPEPIEDEDPDVAEERREVESGSRDEQDLVTMRHLCKKYPIPGGEKVAVKNLSFGVHKGEVFAFLGTNGAGKTTTMGILTGEFLPTHGHGWVAGCDVVSDRAAARQQIGFCPQFDALLDLLTPKEHLALYATLRGINPTVRDNVVRHLLNICDLDQYQNIPSHQLSGGNKRKLSLAIALIGSPRVLFLDEPSAGMDPKSRRQLWAVIQRAAQDCSVVLTTHHLEEVEVLGDRVAIMVGGQLKCIGSLQHLKSKFGSGFEMMIKVKREEAIAPLKEFVAREMPAAELTEEKNERLTFELPKEGTQLSAVFRILRDHADELDISDYSLSQTSLELVFLRISEQEQLTAPSSDSSSPIELPKIASA